MSSSELKAKLQEAIALAQAGQRTQARRLLDEVVAADPNQELAWMWLATVSTNRQERVRFLERVLALNPNNSTAHNAYVQLTGQAFVPPPEIPRAAPRSTWERLTQDTQVSMTGVFIIMTLAAVAVVVGMIVVNARNDNKDSSNKRPLPTQPFIVPTWTPTSGYSPTPSRTPFPTPTEGPSPTLIWDVGVPTWTPIPTRTIPPSLTPRPTSTPIPTHTDTPTLAPPSLTFTPLPATDTRTPAPVTATARATRTPAITPSATATPTPSPTATRTAVSIQ